MLLYHNLELVVVTATAGERVSLGAAFKIRVARVVADDAALVLAAHTEAVSKPNMDND